MSGLNINLYNLLLCYLSKTSNCKWGGFSYMHTTNKCWAWKKKKISNILTSKNIILKHYKLHSYAGSIGNIKM